MRERKSCGEQEQKKTEDEYTKGITNRQYLLETHQYINNASIAVQEGDKDGAYKQLVEAARGLGIVLDRLGYR